MNWLSSLFSSPSSSTASARRKMALSTNDAFSLPTTSPVTNGPYAHSTLSTRDADAMPSPSSYAYPPTSSSPTTYDYVPRQKNKSTQGRSASLLPLHNNSPVTPHAPYPSLEHTWARLRRWLAREYPELGDTLNYGIIPTELAELEMALGIALPAAVRESYLLVDGQEAESAAGCSEGLFFGLQFLALEDVLDEWRFWREVDVDPATGANVQLRARMRSIPPGWVRAEYAHRGWVPLATDKAGNYLGVDLDPTPGGGGIAGQVIVFGRDFDTKVVLWRGDGPNGWAHWLAGFVDDLEAGDGFELGQVSDGSEGEEDDVGYESYFFDGTGRAKGEGGGDAGGGLKLTGEYRGWSVLEAWADKSVKRWREAGLLRDTDEVVASAETIAKKSKHGLGVLDIAAASGTGAEVPIPVLASPEGESTPTAALTNYTKRTLDMPTSENMTPTVPTISVTKPPAPKPVNLPSPNDFSSPSPTSSRATSFDADLEQGGKLSLDEVEHPLSGAPVAVKPQSSAAPPTSRRPSDHTTSAKEVREATLVQIPPSDDDNHTTHNNNVPPTKTPIVPDLLQNEESNDRLPIKPMEPVASPVAERQIELAAVAASIDEDGSIMGESSEPSSETLNMTPPTSSETIVSDAQAEDDDDEKGAAKAELLRVEAVEPAISVPVPKRTPAVAPVATITTTAEQLPEEESVADPDTTIRLVGGGGMIGLVSESEDAAEAETENATTELQSSSTTTTSPSKKKKKTPSSLSHQARGSVSISSPPRKVSSPDNNNADTASISSVGTGRESIDSNASGFSASGTGTGAGKTKYEKKKSGFSAAGLNLKRMSRFGSGGGTKRRTESKDLVGVNAQ